MTRSDISEHTDPDTSDQESTTSSIREQENEEFQNLTFEQRVEARRQEGLTYTRQEYKLDTFLETNQRAAVAARERRLQQRREEGRNTARNQRRRNRRRESRVNLQRQNIELRNQISEMNNNNRANKRSPLFRGPRRSRSRSQGRDFRNVRPRNRSRSRSVE
jgi:hypothetical protein